MVQALKDTFPRSRILWRTTHPSDGWKHQNHGQNPVSIHALNTAIRAHAAEWGIDILDVGSMMQQLVPRHPMMVRSSRASHAIVGTHDGMHLVPWLNLAVFNLVLNELWATAKGV